MFTNCKKFCVQIAADCRQISNPHSDCFLTFISTI